MGERKEGRDSGEETEERGIIWKRGKRVGIIGKREKRAGIIEKRGKTRCRGER